MPGGTRITASSPRIPVLFSLSVFSAARLKVMPVAQIAQRAQLRIDHENHVAAVAAVAAVWTAARNVFLPPEGTAAAATRAPIRRALPLRRLACLYQSAIIRRAMAVTRFRGVNPHRLNEKLIEQTVNGYALFPS